MVQQIVSEYTNTGHRNVQADHISHPAGRPPQLGSHIPDVTASHPTTGQAIICEVETADSFDNEHTYSQLRDFRAAANRVGGLLHVALPYQRDLMSAQATANRWSVQVDKWWYGVAA